MTQIDRFSLRAQGGTANRQDSPFVPLVGESAVRLANVGLTPLRIDGLPSVHDIEGGRLVRARRDRVGRLGEFRAFVVEEAHSAMVSVAFVPRPSLDLGVFGTEIVQIGEHIDASFGIYAGAGTWFAGQHAHHAREAVADAAPDLVPDAGPRNARARQRGFSFDLSVEAPLVGRLETLHRKLWDAYVRSLHDALELDVEGADKNARSIEAWKAHRRTVALAARALAANGDTDAGKLYADVMTI